MGKKRNGGRDRPREGPRETVWVGAGFKKLTHGKESLRFESSRRRTGKQRGKKGRKKKRTQKQKFQEKNISAIAIPGTAKRKGKASGTTGSKRATEEGKNFERAKVPKERYSHKFQLGARGQGHPRAPGEKNKEEVGAQGQTLSGNGLTCRPPQSEWGKPPRRRAPWEEAVGRGKMFRTHKTKKLPNRENKGRSEVG